MLIGFLIGFAVGAAVVVAVEMAFAWALGVLGEDKMLRAEEPFDDAWAESLDHRLAQALRDADRGRGDRVAPFHSQPISGAPDGPSPGKLDSISHGGPA